MMKQELRKKFEGTPRYAKFVEDMWNAGFSVRTYSARGMGGAECPAVSCVGDDLQTVIRATNLPVQHDTLGRGYIVYVR
jgi:predicted regulator of amino acid metabolism with ACT domain